MQFDLNVVIIVGRVIEQPELQYTGSGIPVCKFPLLSIRHSIKNPEGEENYFDIVCTGRLAEICKDNLNRNDKIIVQGRLRYRRWERGGVYQKKIDIVATHVQFIYTKKKVKIKPQDINLDDELEDGEMPF